MNKQTNRHAIIASAILLFSFWGVFLSCLFSGCGGKTPCMVIPDYAGKGIRTIAVLPVHDEAGCTEASVLIRDKVLKGLYFKGYKKVEIKNMDEKLKAVYPSKLMERTDQIPPVPVGELLGVDAVMYITLTEFNTKTQMIYAPTSMAAGFELRSARTGITLWKTSYRAVERNYDFTDRLLEMKRIIIFETIIQEVVDKVINTLPEGPETGT
ncbi:MAG: GNA1162 family protein [Syntrophales bacterium]|jgi:hypothetical protein